MSEKRRITLCDPEDPSKTKVCDILVEFRSSVTNKRYILFLVEEDNTTQNKNVQACIIDRSINPPKVEPIETDFEWEMMEHVLSEYLQANESEEPL